MNALLTMQSKEMFETYCSKLHETSWTTMIVLMAGFVLISKTSITIFRMKWNSNIIVSE